MNVNLIFINISCKRLNFIADLISISKSIGFIFFAEPYNKSFQSFVIKNLSKFNPILIYLARRLRCLKIR